MMPHLATPRLAGGIAISVSLLMLYPFKPPVFVGLVALVLAPFLIRKYFYFLTGLALGTASISFLLSPPATQSFKDCTYQAVMTQADYNQQRRGKILVLAAKQITCLNKNRQPYRLADQKILFYDYQKKLSPYTNENIKLTIKSKLEPVSARLNPYAFDYEKYLHEKGLRLQAKSVQVIEQAKAKLGFLTLRNALAKQAQQHLAPPEAALVLALLTGNRSALSQQQKQQMQNTGTSHILAISGLHLALIGGWSWLITQWLWGLSLKLSRYIQPIQAGAIVTLLVISCYAIISGFDIPVRRAWLMFSLLIISWLWLSPINTQSLLLAACLVILTDPYAVLSVSFYFSFTATAVVLWATRLSYSPLGKILIMQATITLALLPITWLVFGHIALGGFFTNLLIIPWLGLWVLPSSLLACLISFFSDSQTLWTFTTFSIQSLWSVIAFFDQLDLTLNPAKQPTLIGVILSVCCVLSCLYQRKTRYLIGYLGLWFPLTKETLPELVMADSRYSSLLIHNGQSAFIINPGRKYRQIDDSKKWQRYLVNHQLSLSAIVLTDDKISHISATQSLLKQHPDTKVVTLQDFALPYSAGFCTPLKVENLSFNTTLKNGSCQAHLRWFNQIISINENTEENRRNAILTKSRLRWQGNIYEAKALGAITLTAGKDFHLSYLRQQSKPWRSAVTATTAKSSTHVVQQLDAVNHKD